jgi:photosystem II stability/assembly factor-like uncharacterized protein
MKPAKYLLIISCLIISAVNLHSQNNEPKIPVNKMIYNPLFTHYSSAPDDAYYNMMEQKFELRKIHGYYLQEPEQWTCLGPTPINFYGTSSGRVSTVAYDPRDPTGNTIFLGGAQGGVWKTTDGGLHWFPKTDNEKALASGSIAIDPNTSGNRSIIYCGTGEGVWFGGAPYSGCGILKSTDGGETWSLFRKGLPNRTIFYKVVVNPRDPNQLFAALQTGLYRSENGGESWEKIIPSDTAKKQCTDVVFSTDGKKVYAIGPSSEYGFYPSIGYWISEDGGNSFEKHEFTKLENRRTKIAVCKNEPQFVTIFFDMGEHTYLCRSSDGGYSFTETDIGAGGGNAGYNLMLAVHPNDHKIIYFGLSNLYKTTDWGVSFCCIGTTNYWGCNACQDAASTQPIHPDIHALDFNPSDPEKIITGCDGGVYSSDNGGKTWNTNLNLTLTLTQFFKFSSSQFNPELIAGGAQDMGMMYKPQNSLVWNISMIGDGANLTTSETLPNSMVCSMTGSIPGTVYYSTNAGITYTTSVNADARFEPGGALFPIISHPTEPGVYFMLKNKETGAKEPGNIMLMRSTDNGASFDSQSPYSIMPVNYLPQTLAISRSNPNIFYATTGNIIPEWHTMNHIYKYDRTANIWTDLSENHSKKIPDNYFSALAVNPTNENEVYIGLYGFKIPHLFKSPDGGLSWINISGNLPDSPVNDIIIYYSGERTKNILAATDAGVYISTNDGVSWKEYGAGLPNCLITKMYYNRVSCKLRVSTYGRGIWEAPVPGVIYIDDNYVLNSDDNGVNVDNDIVVTSGGNLIFPFPCKINMKAGTKITVQDGGSIDAKGNEVIFRSQSGDWNGIELQGNAVGKLDNCKFNNTNLGIQRK